MEIPIHTQIKDQSRVSHFLAFYLIHGNQIGVGILGFQRYIAKIAGYDAWISVIITGVIFNILIWLMYKMLNLCKGDLITIHRELFGKWLGGLLSFVFMIYFALQALSILRTFIMIVQAWMFPDLRPWGFGLVYIILVYFAVSKGFRVVTGVCFLGVLFPSYLYLTFLPPMAYGDIRHLLPIFSHSYRDIFAAVKQMTYSYLGIEALLIFYPYLKKPKDSQKWAIFGNCYSIFSYLLVTISTFIYYSPEKLSHTIWATLTMWKIVRLPVVERFEVIGITSWVVVILPNICLLLWCSSRIGKRISNIRQKTFLVVILALLFVSIYIIKDLETIYRLTDITGQIGFYMVYVYIPLLAVTYLFVKKVRKTT